MSRFVQSVKDVAVGLIDQASARLALLGLEIAEERERVMAMMMSALAAAFFVALTVVFGAFWVVAAYWDTPYRLRVIGGLTIGAAVISATVVVLFMRKMHEPTALFSHTLAEFERDRAALEQVK
ncbi:phage holin family protein [Pararobbsia alpina]|uniref:Inner membrane protein YqjE n=1 Tax=Pararobbsia alpina TaxID=621374 RepID=A0A6S7B9J7_9BURK|nr:phage holin family protein [Pararobbsia alpina]CAB3781666.1 hypothetical protein LMG28138_01276 [Pararobbsia alpina]